MDETGVDDFLAHYGVAGMRLGQRKPEDIANPRPDRAKFETKEAYKTAKEAARKARSTARGNRMIKDAGSARKAKQVIIGKMLAKQFIGGGAASMAVQELARTGKTRTALAASLAGNVALWTSFVRDINEYQDVRRANGDKK